MAVLTAFAASVPTRPPAPLLVGFTSAVLNPVSLSPQ
jgi:hypothetical protein